MEKANSSISSFKRFLIAYLLPVTAIVAIVMVACSWFFERSIIFKSTSSGAYKINRMFTEQHNNEIALIGSSRAVGSYVPAILGDSVFNYGIEDTQYDLLIIFLKNELEKNKTTPLVVNFDYEIFDKWFGDIANYIPNVHHADIKNYVGDRYKWYFSVAGIKYFGQYEHYMKMYMADHSGRNYKSNGGFFLTDPFNPEVLAREVKTRLVTTTHWTSDEQKSQTLIQLIASHPQRQIVFCIAPYHPAYLKMFKGYDQLNQCVNALKANSNVVFLDYSHEAYADSLYSNTSHLNYNGAVKFSGELKSRLHALLPTYF